MSDPDDPRTAEHLAQLELIPDNMHRVVAGDMEARDGGIYVGARPAIDLDPDGPAATRDAGDANPRGWQTRGWEEVNGYYSGLRAVMTVGHTANADAAARRGGSRSAAAHEFGHALDRAMMARTGIGISNTASWAEIHRASMEDAEMFGGIGPYFQQPGRAGREEFFAEAFSVWVRHYDPAQPGQANNRLSWAFNLTGRQAGRISEYMVALNGRVDTPAAQRGTRAAGRRR